MPIRALPIDPVIFDMMRAMLNAVCLSSHVDVRQNPDEVTVSIWTNRGDLVREFEYTPVHFIGAFERVQLEVRAALTENELDYLLCSALHIPNCQVVILLPTWPSGAICVHWVHGNNEQVGEYFLHTRELQTEVPVCLAEMTAKLSRFATAPLHLAPLHQAAMAWLGE
jgi:hypothetical protein